jgi:hypothetical protein
VVLAACLPLFACTPSGSDTTPSPSRQSLAAVRFDGIRFDVECMPVAEALVDIELPRAGQPKLRAITGLWDHQAVAVIANDPKGCGVWTLALADGLSEEARRQIQTEVARGVEDFGVTATPVPHDEGSG